MNKDNFSPGIKRRAIEDKIIAHFYDVNFDQKKHRWLEDKVFWDFVFSWFELVKYYERSKDTAIGANMLDLYAACVSRFQEAARDRNIRERRRDKAADAMYQINYYMNQLMIEVERNGHHWDDQYGTIT